METQLVIGCVTFLAGWTIRGWQHSAPQIPPPNPCACHCGCECISSGNSAGPFVLALAILFAVAGGVAFWFLNQKSHQEPIYQSKGKKGSFGVSGKVLTITG